MNSDFSQLTADGASNAIGSMQEFEVLTRHGRPNDVDFAVCYAHFAVGPLRVRTPST